MQGFFNGARRIRTADLLNAIHESEHSQARFAAVYPGNVTSMVPPPALTAPPTGAPACLVPKLKGHSLRVNRKKLKKAGCKLGKVKGKKTKSAKVIKQSPKPGKLLAPGTKVSVKLGE